MTEVAEAPADDGGAPSCVAPLVAAAVVSVMTVIVALTVLVAAAFTIGGSGILLAAWATNSPSADRAANIVSIGFGLAVGPAVYLLLALVVGLAN